MKVFAQSNSSYWLTLFFFIFVLGYSLFYFLKIRKNLSPSKSLFLVTLRFIILTLLTFLLLGIEIVVQRTGKEKPQIKFLFDNSKSIRYAGDFSDEIYRRVDSIAGSFPSIEFKYYAFDQQVSKLKSIDDLNLDGTETNFENLFKPEIISPGDKAVIFSDGNWNSGRDPLYSERDYSGLYFFPVGEPASSYDLMLETGFGKTTYFAGKTYQFNVIIRRNMTKSDQVALNVYVNDRLIKSLQVHLAEQERARKVQIPLTFQKKGKYSVKIKIQSSEAEQILWNNTQVVPVNVLPDKYHILVEFGKPSPDIRFWKMFFHEDSLLDLTFRTDIVRIDPDKNKRTKYDAVVFWNFPSEITRRNRVDQAIQLLENKSVPIWINLSKENSFFWEKHLGIKGKLIHPEMIFVSSIQPSAHILLNVYNQPDRNDEFWTKYVYLPVYPLVVQHSKFQPFLIGSQENRPVIAGGLWQKSLKPILITSFENIWRWHFYNVAQEEYIDGIKLWLRSVLQYLIRQKDFRPLNVAIASNRRIVNTSIPIEVSVLDVEGNPIQDVLIKMKIFRQNEVLFYKEKFYNSSDGTPEVFYFHPTDSGNYHLVVDAVIGDKVLDQYSQDFNVESTDIEKETIGLNFTELQRLAQGLNAGIFRNMDELTEWLKEISGLKIERKTVNRVFRIQFNYLWLILLILLVSLEWGMRRFWNEL